MASYIYIYIYIYNQISLRNFTGSPIFGSFHHPRRKKTDWSCWQRQCQASTSTGSWELFFHCFPTHLTIHTSDCDSDSDEK